MYCFRDLFATFFAAMIWWIFPAAFIARLWPIGGDDVDLALLKATGVLLVALVVTGPLAWWCGYNQRITIDSLTGYLTYPRWFGLGVRRVRLARVMQVELMREAHLGFEDRYRVVLSGDFGQVAIKVENRQRAQEVAAAIDAARGEGGLSA